MLELKETKIGHFEVLVSDNRKPIGECLMDVDGYYYFYPDSDGGWNVYALREVTKLLSDLNLEFDNHIKDNINGKVGK